MNLKYVIISMLIYSFAGYSSYYLLDFTPLIIDDTFSWYIPLILCDIIGSIIVLILGDKLCINKSVIKTIILVIVGFIWSWIIFWCTCLMIWTVYMSGMG